MLPLCCEVEAAVEAFGECLVADDSLVGRCYNDVGIGVDAHDAVRTPRHARGCATLYRLCE